MKPITKEGYQGDYTEHDEETGYDEFELRSYDAQIGRWIQNDPYEQYASGYVGMGGDPVNRVDEDGGFDGWIGALAGAVVGGAASYAIAKHNGAHGWGLAAYTFGGAVVGAGLGNAFQLSVIEGNGHFGAYWRGFNKGLFGGSGDVYTKFDPMNRGIGSVEVPQLWGWVDAGTRLSIFDVVVQFASTAELFRAGDIPMNPPTLSPAPSVPPGPTGTTGSSRIGGEGNTVTDNINVTTPTPKKGELPYKTTITDVTPDVTLGSASGAVGSGPAERNVKTSITPGNAGITVTQTNGSVRYKNNVTNSTSTIDTKRAGSRFKIKSVQKQEIPKQRFKIFGISIPFLRR